MKTRTERIARRRREQRESILEAGREVFVREGYEDLSMRKLAERLGCSVGTIYLYFEDKDDLIHTLVEESFEVLQATLEAIEDTGDAIDSLKKKLAAYIDFGLHHPNHYHFAFLMRRTPRDAPVRPHRSFDVLREAVARCRRAGHFARVDGETASQVLWVTIHGITSLLITHPSFPWQDRTTLIARVIDTAVEGLEATAGEGSGRRRSS